MVAVLAVYDLLLIPAILLLEWHYFLDIFGGIAVAAAVWVVNESSEQESGRREGATLAQRHDVGGPTAAD